MLPTAHNITCNPSVKETFFIVMPCGGASRSQLQYITEA
jgi:hypothetical protein